MPFAERVLVVSLTLALIFYFVAAGPALPPWTPCSNSVCNYHGQVVGYVAETGCNCTCSSGFNGSTCSICAAGYERYPLCRPIPCTAVQDCTNNGVVTGERFVGAGCVCACQSQFSGAKCNQCSARRETYPSCNPIPCQISDCNYHGTAIGDYVVGCTCGCATPMYSGPRCEMCAPGFYNYPICEAPCSRAQCHDRGAASGFMFSGCTCMCDYPFAGPSCEQCASDRVGSPPNCREPTACSFTEAFNATVCNGRAVNVSGFTDASPACGCICRAGFNATTNCATCIYGLSGPECEQRVHCNASIMPHNKRYCSGRAVRMSGFLPIDAAAIVPALALSATGGCVCDECEPEYAGANCQSCGPSYARRGKFGNCTTRTITYTLSAMCSASRSPGSASTAWTSSGTPTFTQDVTASAESRTRGSKSMSPDATATLSVPASPSHTASFFNFTSTMRLVATATLTVFTTQTITVRRSSTLSRASPTASRSRFTITRSHSVSPIVSGTDTVTDSIKTMSHSWPASVTLSPSASAVSASLSGSRQRVRLSALPSSMLGNEIYAAPEDPASAASLRSISSASIYPHSTWPYAQSASNYILFYVHMQEHVAGKGSVQGVVFDSAIPAPDVFSSRSTGPRCFGKNAYGGIALLNVSTITSELGVEQQTNRSSTTAESELVTWKLADIRYVFNASSICVTPVTPSDIVLPTFSTPSLTDDMYRRDCLGTAVSTRASSSNTSASRGTASALNSVLRVIMPMQSDVPLSAERMGGHSWSLHVILDRECFEALSPSDPFVINVVPPNVTTLFFAAFAPILSATVSAVGFATPLSGWALLRTQGVTRRWQCAASTLPSMPVRQTDEVIDVLRSPLGLCWPMFGRSGTTVESASGNRSVVVAPCDVGAVAGNVILTVGVAIVCLLAATVVWCARRGTGRSWLASAERSRTFHVSLSFALLMFPPTIVSVILALASPNVPDGEAWALAVTGIAFVTAFGVVVAVVRSFFRARFVLKEVQAVTDQGDSTDTESDADEEELKKSDDEDDDDETWEESDGISSWCRQAVTWMLTGRGRWIDPAYAFRLQGHAAALPPPTTTADDSSMRDYNFVSLLGFTFQGFAPDRVWFLVFDAAYTCVVAALGNLLPFWGCQAWLPITYLSAVLLEVPVIVLLRPHRSWLINLFRVLRSALTAVAALYRVVRKDDMTDTKVSKPADMPDTVTIVPTTASTPLLRASVLDDVVTCALAMVFIQALFDLIVSIGYLVVDVKRYVAEEGSVSHPVASTTRLQEPSSTKPPPPALPTLHQSPSSATGGGCAPNTTTQATVSAPLLFPEPPAPPQAARAKPAFVLPSTPSARSVVLDATGSTAAVAVPTAPVSSERRDSVYAYPPFAIQSVGAYPVPRVAVKGPTALTGADETLLEELLEMDTPPASLIATANKPAWHSLAEALLPPSQSKLRVVDVLEELDDILEAPPSHDIRHSQHNPLSIDL